MQLTKFSPVEWLTYPIRLLMARGDARLKLEERAALSRELIERAKARREMAALLDKEAKLFETLIVETWTRLGEFYAARYSHDSGHQKGRRGGIFGGRSQHVKFERVFTSPEVIWFKIKTRVRTPLGTKNALPHLVRVLDLVSEDTIKEISWSTERYTSAAYENPRRGAWILIHRNEGIQTVPNKVLFHEVLPLYPEDMSQGQFVVGIGEHRKAIYASLAETPHVLIGGATFSGKSNMVNHIISSLMLFTDPTDLKFILIDLKRMEFSYYRHAPHLLRDVVTTAQEAIEALEFARLQIEQRTKIMENSDAKELSEWNRLHPSASMPRIVVIIDEFAQLMQASGSEIRKATIEKVTSIVNLGRAVGIHLIIATQRPAVEVVPNGMKVNMALIIAGRVQNRDQSRVILGNGDAAKLPQKPRGRMYVLVGADQMLIQSPFITTDEVKWSVRIATGKANHLITMHGSTPQIDPGGLSAYIINNNNGVLRAGNLLKLLRPYSIKRQQITAFLEQLIQDKGIVVENRFYKLEKQKSGVRLVFDYLLENDAPEPDPEAPISIQIEAEPAKPSYRDSLEAFIKEACTLEPNAKVATNIFYEAYKTWCAAEKQSIKSSTYVGIHIQEYGTRKERGGNNNIYAGIRINTNFANSEGSEGSEGSIPTLETLRNTTKPSEPSESKGVSNE